MMSPIVDTHLHLIDRGRLRYPWLAGFAPLDRDFPYETYAREARAAGSPTCCTWRSTSPPDDIESETRNVAGLAAQPGSLLRGAISACRPEDAGFAAFLERQLADPFVKGFRRVLHVVPDEVSEGARLPREHRPPRGPGRPSTSACAPDQIDRAIALADVAPGVQFVLDHCGVPAIKDRAEHPWREKIAEIARRPNVAVKISGVVAYADGATWTVDDIRPYVEHAIERFGWDRVVWGSDWPVCTLTASLSTWMAATHAITPAAPRTSASGSSAQRAPHLALAELRRRGARDGLRPDRRSLLDPSRRTCPRTTPALPVWNAENWFYEDFEVGHQIRSLRRTISEGESMQFNALVLDMHPYVADQMFAEREGIFGKRLVAGAFVFSAGLGLVATNCVNAFSYGYDKLRFIKPVFIGDTIYSIRTHLDKRPKYKDMGLIRASYQVFKGEGELVMYCEHLQTVKYRDAAAFARSRRERGRMSAGLLEGVTRSRHEPVPVGAVRRAAPRRPRRAGDQDRAAGRRRSLPAALSHRHRDRRQFDALPRHQSRQAGLRRRLQEPGRHRGGEASDRQGRRRHPELPARRHRAARPRLRLGESDQSRHRLRLDHRLWRGRPVGDAARAGSARAGPHRASCGSTAITIRVRSRSASPSPISWRAARSSRAFSRRSCGAAGRARARISRRAFSRRWWTFSSRS